MTVPADGEGTSIDALSDSKVINGIVKLDDVAGLHRDFDDRHVLEVADIRHFHIDDAGQNNLLGLCAAHQGGGNIRIDWAERFLVSDQRGVRLLGIDTVFTERVGNERSRHRSFVG